jgi:hypothetical protein
MKFLKTVKHHHIIEILGISIIFFVTSCGLTEKRFSTDEEMLTYWKDEQAQLMQLVENCQRSTKTTGLVDEFYSNNDNNEIDNRSVSNFDVCQVELPKTPEKSYQLKYVARDFDKTQILMVTNQSKLKVGWRRSTSLLEEKGFLYTSQKDLAPLSSDTRPVGKLTIVKEALDPLSGNYQLTGETATENACEVWMFRPIDPNWYIFYHQNRECQFRGF